VTRINASEGGGGHQPADRRPGVRAAASKAPPAPVGRVSITEKPPGRATRRVITASELASRPGDRPARARARASSSALGEEIFEPGTSLHQAAKPAGPPIHGPADWTRTRSPQAGQRSRRQGATGATKPRLPPRDLGRSDSAEKGVSHGGRRSRHGGNATRAAALSYYDHLGWDDYLFARAGANHRGRLGRRRRRKRLSLSRDRSPRRNSRPRPFRGLDPQDRRSPFARQGGHARRALQPAGDMTFSAPPNPSSVLWATLSDEPGRRSVEQAPIMSAVSGRHRDY